MPCHRARDPFALPVSAAGDPVLPSGVAVPSVATERARPGCPERGGRDFSSLRIGSLSLRAHAAEQQEQAELSKILGNPSRGDQIGACVMIAMAALLPLAALFLGGRVTLPTAFTGAGGGAWTVREGAVGPDLLLSLPGGTDHPVDGASFGASRNPARLNGRYSASSPGVVAPPHCARVLSSYRPVRRVGALTIAEHQREPLAPANSRDGRATVASSASAGSCVSCHERDGEPGQSYSARGTSGAQGDPATGCDLALHASRPASCLPTPLAPRLRFATEHSSLTLLDAPAHDAGRGGVAPGSILQVVR